MALTLRRLLDYAKRFPYLGSVSLHHRQICYRGATLKSRTSSPKGCVCNCNEVNAHSQSITQGWTGTILPLVERDGSSTTNPDDDVFSAGNVPWRYEDVTKVIVSIGVQRRYPKGREQEEEEDSCNLHSVKPATKQWNRMWCDCIEEVNNGGGGS